MDQQKQMIYGGIFVAGILLVWLSSRDTTIPEVKKMPPQAVAAAPIVTENRIGNLAVELPEQWIMEEPGSSMRLAQFRLPNALGDSDETRLIVFDKIGGSVSDNLDHWYAQFEQPDGSDSKARAQLISERINGLPVTIVYLDGNLISSGMGMGAVNKTDYSLMGAIIETSAGAYYIKSVGPAATIELHRNDFEGFIRSINYLE